MQFESFQFGLAIMGYEPLYHDLQTRQAYAWFFGSFYFYCSLDFYILGVFLLKQYYPTRACWIWDDYSQLGYAPRWLSIISYPTRTHGIIVKDTIISMFFESLNLLCKLQLKYLKVLLWSKNSLPFFLQIFKACLLDTRLAKLLSFKLYPKAFCFERKFSNFTIRHYSRSRLTDWTSEGWIVDKMTSKTPLA